MWAGYALHSIQRSLAESSRIVLRLARALALAAGHVEVLVQVYVDLGAVVEGDLHLVVPLFVAHLGLGDLAPARVVERRLRGPVRASPVIGSSVASSSVAPATAAAPPPSTASTAAPAAISLLSVRMSSSSSRCCVERCVTASLRPGPEARLNAAAALRGFRTPSATGVQGGSQPRRESTMRSSTSRVQATIASATLILPLTLTACGGDGGDGNSGSGGSTSRSPDATTPTSTPSGPGLPQGNDPVDLDPADFTAGSDNPYFPLEPRRQWTYQETDETGASVRVVVTVTTQTRKIANGVEARVVRDTVTEDGELIEDTLDWYAQDGEGNVWYLGEETAEFENGELTTREGSFEAGVDGALPGIIMPAEPEVGISYRQEYYEGEAEDNGAVLALGQQADVAQGHFDDVLLTADSITIEPDVLEYKLYAPGVGLVLALGISGGGGREELVATKRVGAATARAAGTTPLGTPYR